MGPEYLEESLLKKLLSEFFKQKLETLDNRKGENVKELKGKKGQTKGKKRKLVHVSQSAQEDLGENLALRDHGYFRDCYIDRIETNVEIDRLRPLTKLTEGHLSEIENGGWIDADIVQHAQILIKKIRNIEGLERTVLSLENNFSLMEKEFIQILNVNNNHWVCISSLDCKIVKLYDSLHENKVSNTIVTQVKQIVGPKSYEDIHLVKNLQQQDNCNDCGVFAIAFATCLAYSDNPEEVKFNTKEMRSHLSKCLKEGSMSRFPIC